MTEIEQLKNLRDVMEEAEAPMAKARNLLLVDALVKEFGKSEGLSGEEMTEVARKDATVVALDKALDELVKREIIIGNRLYKLEHDGTNPPF